MTQRCRLFITVSATTLALWFASPTNAAGQMLLATRSAGLGPATGMVTPERTGSVPAAAYRTRFADASPRPSVGLNRLRVTLAAVLRPDTGTISRLRALIKEPPRSWLAATAFAQTRLRNFTGRRAIEHVAPEIRDQNKVYCLGLRIAF